jgi:hypothetical protein
MINNSAAAPKEASLRAMVVSPFHVGRLGMIVPSLGFRAMSHAGTALRVFGG